MTVEGGLVVGIIGAVAGGGVTWGVMTHTVSSHTEKIKKLEPLLEKTTTIEATSNDHSERINKLEVLISKFGDTCDKQRSNCPSNLNMLLSPLYEKLNKLSEDMAYIRGRWEREEKGK